MNSGPLSPRTDWSCTGCACAFLLFVVLAVWYLHATDVHGSAHAASCMSNTKQSTTGLLMYSQDFDGYLPPAGKWHDGSYDYVKNESVYVCPTRQKLVTGYAFNRVLSGRSSKQGDPEKVPLLFESSLGQRNGADALQSFVKPHESRGNVSFLDGHVQKLARAPSAMDGLQNTRRKQKRDAVP